MDLDSATTHPVLADRPIALLRLTPGGAAAAAEEPKRVEPEDAIRFVGEVVRVSPRQIPSPTTRPARSAC